MASRGGLRIQLEVWSSSPPLLPDNVVYPIRYDPLSRGQYSRWEGVLRRMEGLALSHSLA